MIERSQWTGDIFIEINEKCLNCMYCKYLLLYKTRNQLALQQRLLSTYLELSLLTNHVSCVMGIQLKLCMLQCS